MYDYNKTNISNGDKYRSPHSLFFDHCLLTIPLIQANLLSLPQQMHPSIISDIKKNDNRPEEENPPPKCRTCLITGVLTCTAVSGYFFKIALIDLPESTKHEVVRQKRFLLGFGSAWAVAGVYRFYLG